MTAVAYKADTAVDALIHAANGKGGIDNVSVILIKWSDSK
jgi:serine/threonine protein phosphatase PrpC